MWISAIYWLSAIASKFRNAMGLIIPSALVVKVVGLVTRKDLARYHMGKDGLEELHLAQTWLVVKFILDPAFRAPALDRNISGAGQSLSPVKDAKHKPATCTICPTFSILRARLFEENIFAPFSQSQLCVEFCLWKYSEWAHYVST